MAFIQRHLNDDATLCNVMMRRFYKRHVSMLIRSCINVMCSLGISLTVAGWGSMFKHALMVNALRFLDFSASYSFGSASISKPFQFLVFSKNSVFERVSPLNAPHSTKKPPV